MGHEGTITAYIDAVNAERWPDVGALFTADGVYQATGSRLRTGRAEIVALFSRMFTMWADHCDTVTAVFGQGDRAAAEIEFRATTLDGRPVSFPAVDLFRFRDGLIAELTTWYDAGAVHTMLGRKATG